MLPIESQVQEFWGRASLIRKTVAFAVLWHDLSEWQFLAACRKAAVIVLDVKNIYVMPWNRLDPMEYFGGDLRLIA